MENWKINNGESWAIKEYAAIANMQDKHGDTPLVILANMPTENLTRNKSLEYAKLIAAAPNLLEALKDLLKMIHGTMEETDEITKALTAIKKATD